MTLSKLSSLSLHGIDKTIVLAIALIFCFSTVACHQSYTLPNLTVLPLQETYTQAESIAKDWQLDAQLNSVAFEIEFSSSPGYIFCDYTFLSEKRREFLLVSVIADQSGYHLRTVEDAWPVDRSLGMPIIFEEINLESKDALQAILENGGRTFFERYQIRQKRFLDYFMLSLERLDEYKGEGELIWTGGFAVNSPHAALYMSVEDATGDLLKIKAYGEQEQDYWLREVSVTERILTGESKNFVTIQPNENSNRSLR
ncbi:MAG: hypothetical protein ACOYYU_13405 [Chloroflexota bacterium]